MDQNILLCVDDDRTVLSSLRTMIGNHLGASVTLELAESGQEALEISADLEKTGHEVGVVICDFIMPGMRGDELLVRLHKGHPRMVKIMLTGQSDVEGIKRAINEANLYRFMEKPFNNADMVLTIKSAMQAYHQDIELALRNAELERTIRDLEAIVRLRTAELTEKNRQLAAVSQSDRLTGLYNRLRLDQVLESEYKRSQRSGSKFAAILLDIDHFKSVNDTHGHQAGDQVLITIARLLAEGTREVDTVGRWGGEEFLVICPDTDADGAIALAQKLRQMIANHTIPVVGKKTSSFGVAVYKADESVESLLGRADKALYKSKESGRNRVECET